MGGLSTLLQMRRHGTRRIEGYINLEGNLSPEDCLFSRHVVSHDLDSFEPQFRRMMGELLASRYSREPDYRAQHSAERGHPWLARLLVRDGGRVRFRAAPRRVHRLAHSTDVPLRRR
jgi:hypothetical protein